MSEFFREGETYGTDGTFRVLYTLNVSCALFSSFCAGKRVQSQSARSLALRCYVSLSLSFEREREKRERLKRHFCLFVCLFVVVLIIRSILFKVSE